ncbi:hypothetical protein L8V77_02500 [Campylobacter sp. IFREMER_LSEM_CL2127]|uniref:hypothetical protein n=1 Tax=Campylobacter sp. IFREMER_LSEM_CL2127 TaxID=2911619 RepID=UPI0021E816CA|nr:hypothetical protein [Campylobacter sp. IFREMER_LSEM_CL2127]MCV3381247.1 hypothetical protein [Campylobacter sp. IFREMER_LSEM_CL2127]
MEKINYYDIEKNKKSFIVNLNNNFHVEFIEFEIFDMLDVKIYFSEDKITWLEKKEECLLINANKYSLTYNHREKYQYLKINTEIDNIKNKNINIFVRKFPGLMIAARTDGFGARFMSILNAMYLAEYTGFKFGFVWEEVELDKKSIKKIDNNELAGIYLSNEYNIFDEDFIGQYSYTNKLRSNDLKDNGKEFNEFVKEPDNFWGNYVDFNIVRRFFGIEVFKKYPKIWNSLIFSKSVQNIIDKANKKTEVVFSNKFIAIHIRSGDIVYDERIKKLGVGVGKAMPIEIAMHLIEENLNKNEKIVLFGDDFTSLRELRKLYGVSIIEDFIDENLSGIERIVFEIVFMSNAKEIFSGASSFAKIAAYIGLGREPTFFTNFYSNEQQLIIIQKYNISKFHILQRVYSLYYASYINLKFLNDDIMALSLLKQANILDKTNCLYELLIIYICLRNRNFSEAERILRKSLFKYKDYMENYSYGVCHLDIKKLIAKMSIDDVKKYPNLLAFFRFIQDDIYEILLDLKDKMLINSRINTNSIQSKLSFQTKYGTAKTRIQNQLSYKLGQAMIVNSKSFLGYLIMPIVLLSIIISHKQEQKIYQEKIKKDPSLKLPPLESYPDYKEALKLKNHLSYKLGQALIKANKTWYKGGYVKLWFEVRKLKQKIKKGNRWQLNLIYKNQKF